MKTKLIPTLALMGVALPLIAQIDVTVNGGFETGTTSDWASFPTANSTFDIIGDASEGSFAAEVFNNDLAAAAIIKQANIGIGTVAPGQAVSISFDAKGAGAVGGVVFAEFFSEIDGGGTSSAEILGGAPLVLDPTSYQAFNFNTVTGPDVSGGITLQFAVVTGGAAGSESLLNVDNVSVTVVPEPSTFALILGAGSLGFLVLRRRFRKS